MPDDKQPDKAKPARVARLSQHMTLERALQSLVLAALPVLGQMGSSKLEAFQAAQNTRLDGIEARISAKQDAVVARLGELAVKVEAQDRLELDKRVRGLEGIGSERRFGVLEGDVAEIKADIRARSSK